MTSKLKNLVPIAIVLIAVVGWWKTRNKNTHITCETTKGQLQIVVVPEWSPLGAERFLQLVDDGFYEGLPLFRCIENFVCQFGATPPKPNAKVYAPFPDDPKREDLRQFKVGYLSFAGYAANSRATHVFVALDAVPSLGAESWETPFGYVEGNSFETLKKFNTSYGETAPSGTGPDMDKIESPEGAAYLKEKFPLLDSFLSCSRK